ncbi:peptidase domain-containing ABC transporter [Emticicia sp. SJ17W-69]|uniref:peptidase domain-containing ABC transporter n=1 Tax=Emticicia sp. SJ17W-69 TaxID=3421657 RepID=UPI003EBA4235
MNQKVFEKTLVRQQDQSDCGVACLQWLVRYYRGEISLEKLRELSGTSKQGTTLLGLYQAANQIGFVAEGCEADINALIEHDEPTILHVQLENNLQHYIICFSYLKEGGFVIGDPSGKIQNYSQEELDKIWMSKKCLTLKPTEQFQQYESIWRAKKKWLFNLIRDDANILIASIAIGLSIAVLGLVMSVFSQKLIDEILPTKNFKKLYLGVALVFFLLLIRVGFVALHQYILLKQGKDFNSRIVGSFYDSLLFLPKSFFDTRKIGDLVARMNDTARIQRVISQIVGNVMIDVLVVFVSLGFLFSYQWQIGLFALIVLPFYFLLIYRFNKPVIEAQRNLMSAYALRESNYISTLQGIRTIKNFNKQPFFSQLNRAFYGNFQDKVFSLGKIDIRISIISSIASVIFLVSILAYLCYEVLHGKMKIGEMMAVLGMASSLMPSISNLALLAIPINEAKIAFDRMFEFVSIPSEKEEGVEIKEFKSLIVNNLSFRFAGRKQLFNNISFEIRKGECVAIIGESGSGKSTLSQILEKFYEPENGQILINNKSELSKIQTNSWRKILGIIPQEIHLFNGTVIENICIGEIPKDLSEFMAFCKEYGFEDFINNLPQGIMTIVGEEGINLSGGQKQIIALLRVLYKKPQLLILDEATSALDRNIEKILMNLLKKLKSEIGILFISHRLNTLKNVADSIYILENGEITHSGNHEQLLLSENIYSQYWLEMA